MLKSFVTSSSFRRLTSQVAFKSNVQVPAFVAMANPLQNFSRQFSDAVNDVLKGSVKWFDTKKGFGFIVPDDGSPDVFVHQTSIHAEGFRSLDEGEVVEFEISEDNSGRRSATGVTGPEGAYVKGAPRRNSFDDYNRSNGNDGY
mmetsp:Transcript_8450/g.10686  ORF Transcript_8450/g.10686 Transcript_8450/m.10686 type:complete len:144 (-) Transcript_8450:216-647(-)